MGMPIKGETLDFTYASEQCARLARSRTKQLKNAGFTTVAEINPPLPVRRIELLSSFADYSTKLFNGFFE